MKKLFLSFPLILLVFFLSNLAKAEDIESLEKQLEQQDLEQEITSDDDIDELDLKKELEELRKEKNKKKNLIKSTCPPCRPIVKTKIVYKNIPLGCQDVNNYYLVRKYSVYDLLMTNKDTLRLTPTQIELIERIHRNVENKMLDMKARLNLANKQLNTYIKQKNINAIRGILVRIASLKLRISGLDIAEYIKIMEILTDKQKSILENLVGW
ncbi:MAG: hypothetical protein DSY66_04900 [Persephonella sp.]|nr:MAG: hypothetical protein DSY53_03465 [Persephonella sp.]RUM60114.1 MAG: hypothetical protein DSY66_04900 [Persephonella sp.]